MSERLIESIGQQKAKELFRQTYFISQGNSALQQQLYKWLFVTGNLNPDDLEDKPQWLGTFYAPYTHSSKGQIGSNTDDQFREWARMKGTVIGTRRGSGDTTEIESSILLKILEVDVFYQVVKRPGRIQQQNIIPDSAQDAHKSFLRHYVLTNNFPDEPFSTLFKKINPYLVDLLNSFTTKTRIQPEYNIMKRLKRDTMYAWIERLKTETKISYLVQFWEKNHPEYKFLE